MAPLKLTNLENITVLLLKFSKKKRLKNLYCVEFQVM